MRTRGWPGTGCPAEFARRREQWLRRNGGYSYRSYGEVFRRYLLQPQGSGGASDLDAAGGRSAAAMQRRQSPRCR